MLFFLMALACMAILPVGGALVARKALARRENSQKLLVERYAHLAPRRSWRVAFSSEVHIRSLFKFWSWEDVGVLHLYQDAIAFYGEKHDFEIHREEILELQLQVFQRTNPLVQWVEVETTGGVRYYFCLPKGYHVFGMKKRAQRLLDDLKKWAAGSSLRPLEIT
jgi:hypothetical protein